MSTKLSRAVILAIALGARGVLAETSTRRCRRIPASASNPVTETFTGTLTLNGADTHPFSVSRLGAGDSATIASLDARLRRSRSA